MFMQENQYSDIYINKTTDFNRMYMKLITILLTLRFQIPPAKKPVNDL